MELDYQDLNPFVCLREKHEYHAMCFPNRIDGEQAIYKSLKPFSLSFAKRESSRITSIAF